MPRRKRGGDLASSAAKRRKQKENRRNETEEEREARLQNQRTRMSTLRSGKAKKEKKIKKQTKKVTSKEFYAYRLMIRDNEVYNHILNTRRLFQQFLVDMYAKIEAERMLYIRLNQKKLRTEEYIHLRDAIVNDGNIDDIGTMVILPSSYIGSPRHMHEYTQDAMTYVRKYGRPDLFITFTCNSSWPEIKEQLKYGQTSMDRHDIIARVFDKTNKIY
ncbi:hypothetical protein EVAR_103612_1 [Eumeta japonica]|uniref:Helitron helicase-like domain-containing protein n=1 Tax=Eumeta variegata TaxID=151549 RepID=A0A4C1SDL3_EUMVA|nr:hypothetical protein EVAR_103612_1 [Eumeta japonica]